MNGTCDPGTKTCISGGNPDDHTPPVFSIVVAPPPQRQATAKLTELDPGSPDGGVDAFRRDESVSVTVTSNDQDLDAGSVKLVVYGVSSNPGAALVVPLSPCGSGNPGASSRLCRQATVSLAPLPLEAFRAVVPLEVSGSDLSNNLGKADAGVNVTRWKWRYSAGAPIYTTPAIADDGTIVFGTSDGANGSLVALSAGGSEKWAVPLGPIRASPSIGPLQSGAQITYVGTAGRPSNLHARFVADGSDAGTCLASTDAKAGGQIFGTLAIFTAAGLAGNYESATAFASQQGLVTIRPRAQGPDQACLNSLSNAAQTPGQNLVATDSALFLGTSDGAIRAFVFDSGSWAKNSNWSSGAGYVPVADGALGPLALTDRIYGTAKLRGGFAVRTSDGALIASGPDAGLANDPGGLVVGANRVFFDEYPGAQASFYTALLDLASLTSEVVSSGAFNAPVIGAGGNVYVLSADGGVSVRSPTGILVWTAGVEPGQSFQGSPTIDCA
ncbi:MAG TPA: PQQ-binding-like beta-propeller repeat protein, partial [Myxococcaceae bacterium]|nr:PQQ-binding-like beta-propeller repeat protein [Myxococcaceae bacterium]